MLELWVDEIPMNDVGAVKETCRDFMRLIRDHNIQICSSSSQTEWSKHITKWQEFFEKNELSGDFLESIAYWKMPMFKEKSEFDSFDYEAAHFLKKTPDHLLRHALQQKNERLLSNASEFKSHFMKLIGNSHRVAIYDRYLMKIQGQLMRINDGKIGHHESFDNKGSFIESIRGLNLILHSLPAEVRELAIHSDMLDWNKFRQKAENHGLQVRLEDFEDWIGNARSAQKRAMEFIAQHLTVPREIDIEFYDCWVPDKGFSKMEHDRYVCFSQSRAFISSGGFRNVHKDITEDELEIVELSPKTYLLRILRDPSVEITKENRRIKKSRLLPQK